MGRSPGEGNGNPLQYCCLENPTDRGAWQASVHGVARVGHDLATKPPPPEDKSPHQPLCSKAAASARLCSKVSSQCPPCCPGLVPSSVRQLPLHPLSPGGQWLPSTSALHLSSNSTGGRLHPTLQISPVITLPDRSRRGSHSTLQSL